MHDLLCNCGDAHLKNLKILFRSIWRPFVMDNRPFFHPRQTDKCKSLLFKHNTTHLCFSLLHLCKLSSASSTGFRGRTSSFLWKLFPQVTRSGKAGNVRSGRSRECVCVRVWERGEADQRLTVTVHWLEMWNQSWITFLHAVQEGWGERSDDLWIRVIWSYPDWLLNGPQRSNALRKHRGMNRDNDLTVTEKGRKNDLTSHAEEKTRRETVNPVVSSKLPGTSGTSSKQILISAVLDVPSSRLCFQVSCLPTIDPRVCVCAYVCTARKDEKSMAILADWCRPHWAVNSFAWHLACIYIYLLYLTHQVSQQASWRDAKPRMWPFYCHVYVLYEASLNVEVHR